MKKNVGILLFLILALSAIGQNSDVSMQTINIEDGLSQSQVSCLLIDKKGFIWVGTQDGLNKYHGYGFKVYRHDPLDSTSISSNAIQALIEDTAGNLWIGTRNGLNKFDRKNGKFKYYLNEPYNPFSLSGNNVNALYQSKDGAIWVKTSEKLDKLDLKTDKFTHYEYYHDIFNLSPDNNFFSILQDYKGDLWIGTKDGLNFFNPSSEQNTRYFHDSFNPNSISNSEIYAIFEDKDNDLIVGTANGLNIYNRKKNGFDKFFIDIDKNKNQLYNAINDIFQDDDGEIWIGTDAGLLYFDKTEGKFFKNKQGNINLTNTIDTKVSKIIKDNSDIYWIGTWESGLIKLDGHKKKFRFYPELVNNNPNLLSGGVASVYIDSKENLWVGYWGSGLTIYNRETKDMRRIVADREKAELFGNFVHVIYEDSKNKIWLGTRTGITIYDQEEDEFYHITQLYKFVSSVLFVNNRINDIIEDHNGNIWIGSQHGLFKFDYNTIETFNHHLNDKNSLCSNEVLCLLEDKSGLIWVGTNEGLDRYDPATNRFYHYKKGMNSRKGLSNNSVLCIIEDRQGRLWFGTESGLNKYNRKTETFTFYIQREEGGFANDYIYGILEDNNGDFWISTNRGIAKFNPTTEFVTNYDLADGLQAYEFNLGAYYKSQNGEFFFGGVIGLNSFFPDSISKNRNIPRLSITSIEKINKEGKTKTYIDDIEEIIITPDVYLFTIEFAALEFNRPEKNQYAYMMEGLDDEWINIGTKHYATFSQIPQGTYNLRIKGSNNDLVWNHEGISVKVVVEPPWYKSTFAYIFYTLFIVVVVFGIIQYRTRSLIKSNQELKEKEQISQEVSRQKEELSNKNQNITDSLNYAQHIIEAMMPPRKLLNKFFPESFNLYMPKDIVSGDFYWYAEKNGKIFVAAVDCTGHGIPGAFMSIIGFDLLRNITKVQGIEEPAQILEELSSGVAETFRGAENMKVNDGMDLAFCVIDKKKRTLEYSGAKNPLYLIRNNNIIDYKANRFSVGLAENLEGHSFKSHKVELEKNDVLYIFSDGYADQFGGPKGKKFKYRRFRHLLLTIHKLPMEQQLAALEQSLQTWRGDLEQVDDILIIGIKPLI